MGEKFVRDMAQVIRRGDHEPNIMGRLEENKSVKMLRTTKYREFMVSLYKTNSFVYHGLVYILKAMVSSPYSLNIKCNCS